jgi:cytochrome c oxidase subunit IV
MSNHIVPLRTYYLVFLTLIVCTAITVAVSFVDLGRFNVVVALGIAILKATLVVLFFMHVKYSGKLTWVVVAGSLFWLGILIVMTAGDYLTRVRAGTYG